MSFDPGSAGGASLDGWTLVFVRDFRQPPEVVWAALTDPDQLDRWAPFTAAGDLGRVGETTLTTVDGDDRTTAAATVRTAEKPALLEYTWGDDRLRWELSPHGGGTRLVLRHTLTTDGIAPMVAAGWHLCAEVLRRLLDGDPVPVIRGRDAMRFGFDDLRAAYAKSFAN